MPEESPERQPLSARTLRGIAHPLRVRLLNLLREDGPSTATKLAQRTDESTGATSYHLRQLALYGFVEPDPAHSGGRERWWRATTQSTSLEAETFREAPVEAEAYLRAVAGEYSERMDRWLTQAPGLPPDWDEAATLSNWRFRLTSAESAQLLADLTAALAPYRADAHDLAAPDGALRVDLQIQLMPFLGGNP
jgi:DNA-binding MarR family transcriptional regulator